MPEDQKTEETATEPVAETQAQDVPRADTPAAPKPGISRLDRFKTWYTERKKWTIPASVLLFILVIVGIPFTRYAIAGLVIKHDITIKVQDATAHTPVSGATLAVGSVTAQTDSNGKATLHKLKAGHHKVDISKKYYQGRTVDVLSPAIGGVVNPTVELTATGRQIKVTIKDLVNKSVLADVTIKVADITAKTDSTGTALLVLPAGIADQKAQLSANGYNEAEITIKVNDTNAQDNTFDLTPTGKVYFLSKLSGKIDVVKTNLDGSGRQTVLGGTGNEDDRNTVLLASRDWKYLALLSRRAGSNPSIYLISTADDSNTVIDSGSSSDYSLVGWAGDNFVYSVNHNDIPLWQSGHQSIKSYNAQTKKSQTLDQTTSSGTSNFDYVGQTLGAVYAYEDQVYYVMNWGAGANLSNPLNGKQVTFNSVKPDGTAKKAIKSFGQADGADQTYLSLDEQVKSPDSIALHFYDGSKDNFYVYSGGQVKDDPKGSNDTFFSSAYPTYLLSPSGNNTFWSEPRDGKNTLFVGDESGQSGKQIASLSDYNTYGWFTNSYLLVSKNSSELYIMDKDGKQSPVKISDYHKPAVTFQGYGGGYGGL